MKTKCCPLETALDCNCQRRGVLNTRLMGSMDTFSSLVGRTLRIAAFAEPVRVIRLTVIGQFVQLEGEGVNTGLLKKAMVKPSDLSQALLHDANTDAFTADFETVQLGVEAHRVRLGYSFDPHFAVSSSVVDPLPHQLEAVYKYLLPQPRVRFMLADDPGAGKTIMAGLLLKELVFRQALERVLIVTPANLTDQWRREMSEKFHETFTVMNSATVQASFGSNPWEHQRRVITSIDFAKREDHRRDLEAVEWDLVIVDEAHKMTATMRSASGDTEKIERSERYKLGEVLSKTTTHLLLMTATPHRGDPEGFRLLLDLIEPSLFATKAILRDAVMNEENPLFLRRLKENMLGFDGKPLFPPRHPHTVSFKLSIDEQALYDAVTDYVSEHFAKAFTLKKRNIGFAMTVLQRRVTSSAFAAYRSLKARHGRLQVLREDAVNTAVLIDQPDLPADIEDWSEEETWELEQDLLERLTLAKNLPELDKEIAVLGGLVKQAEQLVRLKTDRKLEELKRVVTTHIGSRNEGEIGERLLIFTEHRDTLNFLKAEVQDWGYRVTSIDGSMKLEERIAAEREFRDSAQIMIATEAAGEGINLQFCHLMVNYDIPWNPNRLEQRMGRIHRYGQKLEVHIYNLVASNTREGEVLGKLLQKLEEMRIAMGSDRVYDVLGEILEGVDLENLLRENLAQRMTLEQIKASLESRLDLNTVRSLMDRTEAALAHQFVNLAALSKDVETSRLQRLHPEYTERFFRAAFAYLGGRLESRRETGIYAIPSVPAALRDQNHPAARRVGGIPREYRRVAFEKTRAREQDAELISPGHPLFEIVLESILERTQDALRQGATLALPVAQELCLGFFVVAVQDATGATVNQRLVCLEFDGHTARAVPNHVLLDALPAETSQPLERDPSPALDAALSDLLEPLLTDTHAARGRNLQIRRKYAEASYRHLARESQRKLAEYRVQQRQGKNMELAIIREEQRADAVTRRFQAQKNQLEQEGALSLLPPARLTLLRVLPAPVSPGLEEDDAAARKVVELIAMRVAAQYEALNARDAIDVSLDGVGYDLHSQSADGKQRRCIEVKGRAGEGGVNLYVSEVVTAGRLGDEYYLYIVTNCTSATPKLHIIQNPALQLGAEVKAVQFQVSLEAWRAVATQVEA